MDTDRDLQERLELLGEESDEELLEEELEEETE